MGIPQNGWLMMENGDAPKWLVYKMENPNPKWMMTGGTPVSGNLHMALSEHREYHKQPLCNVEHDEMIHGES